MDKSRKRKLSSGLKGLAVALFVSGVVVIVAGYGSGDKPLPEQAPETVVEKFYEYISEAKIRGGTLLIREAFKLTDSGQSRYDQAKFLEVINRYPSGFKATIVKSEIRDRRAEVAIEYEMASSFGGAYKVGTIIPLNVDEQSNTWKIDFRGDTDNQDIAKFKKEYAGEVSELTAAKDAE